MNVGLCMVNINWSCEYYCMWVEET